MFNRLFKRRIEQQTPLVVEQPTHASPKPNALMEELERLQAAQRELTASKQAAEASLMAKSEFLATMSHEIRTPLNGMLPLMEMLLSTPLSTEQKDYAATAHESAREMFRIVNDILDYSKIESGTLRLECVPLNVKDLVDSVVRLMECSARKKTLQLSAQIDPSVRLSVRGDALRLRQVLANLVGNAIKFTERGSIAVRVVKQSETRTRYVYEFSVKDSGVGLPTDVADRLFQPFSQVDGSASRTFGGTGLGLVICRRLVEAMGGQIGVTSAQGIGSTFWFSVPLLKIIGDIKESEEKLGRKAVLFCRDAALAAQLDKQLQTMGIQASRVESSSDVLVKLRATAATTSEWRYDVAIVDWSCANRTLLSLVRNIGRDPALEAVRLLVIESDGTTEPIPQEIREHKRVVVLRRANADQLVPAALETFSQSDGSFPAAISGSTGPVIDIRKHESTGKLIDKRVLLVDDIAINRHVGERVLQKMGLHVEIAEGGREALARLSTQKYDAVLMDCQMPDVDGYTATRAWRERESHEGTPRTPVIAMTANAMVGDREKCLAAGMDDYLTKPLDRNSLELILEKWFVAEDLMQVAAEEQGMQATEPAIASESFNKTRRAIAAIETALLHSDVRTALRAVHLLFEERSTDWLASTAEIRSSLNKALEECNVSDASNALHELKDKCDSVRLRLR